MSMQLDNDPCSDWGNKKNVCDRRKKWSGYEIRECLVAMKACCAMCIQAGGRGTVSEGTEGLGQVDRLIGQVGGLQQGTRVYVRPGRHCLVTVRS